MRMAERVLDRSWAELMVGQRDWGRDGTMYLAVRYGGHRLAELVGHLGGLKYTAAAQAVRRFGVRLGQVPIDTVSASFNMKDEDDNSEATKVCNVMRAIGDELGILMAPVHHYGKNPESGLRGASAWKGPISIH